MAVKTNVKYIVVATAVLERESAASIAEALRLVQSGNPAWKTSRFMIDFSFAEMSAIETCFPGR